MDDKQKTSRHRWVGYAAACWALIFAIFHIVWAAGWYILLDPMEAAAAFASPWMLAYDLIAAGMCIVAVPVALALALPGGRHVPRRLLVPLALIGAGLLALRAVARLLPVAYFAAVGGFRFHDPGLWAPGRRALRAGASLMQVAYFAAVGRFRFQDLGLWEPWFYLGAVLFTLNVLWYWQRERSAPPDTPLQRTGL